MRYTKKRFVHGLKSYIANLILIWLAILFYRYNGYYINFLKPQTQIALFWLAITYSVVGFIMHVVIPSEKLYRSKGHVVGSTIKRSFFESWRYLKSFSTDIKHSPPKISSEEKTSILFVIVKIFYLPIMLNFLIGNYTSVNWHLKNWPGITEIFSIGVFNGFTYAFLVSLFFLVDTLYFTFGYSVEAKVLKNKVKSVEPTVFGWIVALLCYPPFNGLFTQYSSWYANDAISFGTPTTNYAIHIILLVLVFVYLSATLSLGPKSSNLTNRGIVTTGAYRFVRHPAYIGKNLFWWITIIPVISIPAVLSMGAWSTIYFFRAITEERHLIKDPDYQAYCKRVKYRFIPYVF
jgi:protein-S-isoprenylcysteine O-methyltransferase Ste14